MTSARSPSSRAGRNSVSSTKRPACCAGGSARAHLVDARTTVKNQIHATIIPNLKRVPVSDLFGVRGLAWLAEQELPVDERETIDACLRHTAFLDREIAELETHLAAAVLASADMSRVLTMPGVNSISAAAFMAAVGDVARFPTARHAALGFTAADLNGRTEARGRCLG